MRSRAAFAWVNSNIQKSIKVEPANEQEVRDQIVKAYLDNQRVNLTIVPQEIIELIELMSQEFRNQNVPILFGDPKKIWGQKFRVDHLRVLVSPLTDWGAVHGVLLGKYKNPAGDLKHQHCYRM